MLYKPSRSQHFELFEREIGKNWSENIVINGNEVFYFITCAEIFRGYINEFADFIQNYKRIE